MAAGHDQFPLFDSTVRRRGRAWRWFVSTTEGRIIMRGSEGSRSAATYRANSAIFLLLSAVPTNRFELDLSSNRNA
jgi:hypothetical protein